MATIVNAANLELSITVHITSPATHLTTSKQITLKASGQATIGVDDGIQLQSGDEITLRCATYRDQTSQIR